MGGENRINEMTGIFFAEIAKREELGHFFVNVPVDAIRAHQAKFFKVLFGPEEERPTPDELKDYMVATHVRLFRDMGLDETHFDVVGECLGIALQEMKIPQDQVEEAFGIIGPLRISFEYGARIANQERKMSSAKKAALPTANMNTMRSNKEAVLPSGVTPPEPWLVEVLGGREEVRKWTCALTYRFVVQDRALRDVFFLLPYLEMEPYLHNMLEVAFQDYRKSDSGVFDNRTATRTLRFPLGLANSMTKVDRRLFDKMERHFEEVGRDLIDEEMLEGALQKLGSYKSTMGGSKPIVKTLKGNETAHALKRDASETATCVTGYSGGSSGELVSVPSSEPSLSPKKGRSERRTSKTKPAATPNKGVNGIFTWLMSRRQAERHRQAAK